VIFGNLLTVPIENSLLYVQPLYLESSDTKLPQVQRIIVFYRSPSANPNLPGGQQQNVVMASTLGDALTAIFGGSSSSGVQQSGAGTQSPGTTTPAATSTNSPVAAQLAAQANAEYASAEAALRAGDLVTFGQDINTLGKILAQLKAATATAK
jgi:hypothetical protein